MPHKRPDTGLRERHVTSGSPIGVAGTEDAKHFAQQSGRAEERVWGIKLDPAVPRVTAPARHTLQECRWEIFHRQPDR